MSDSDENSFDSEKWTEEQLNLLKRWMKDFKSYEIMHQRSHNFYATLDALFGTGGIISAAASAVFSSILSLGDFGTNSPRYQVAAAVLSGVSGMVSAIQKMIGFIKIAEHHKYLSTQYSLLWTKIEVQFSIPEQIRIKPEIFIKTVESERANLLRNSESIPSFIFNKWYWKNVEEAHKATLSTYFKGNSSEKPREILEVLELH